MTIALLTLGTRGDVQPFVALAVGLMRAGYDARVAAPAEFRDLVEGHGVAFAPIRADISAITQSDQGKAMLRGNPVAILRAIVTLYPEMMRRVFDDAGEAGRDASAVVFHPKILNATDIAEAAGAPAFAVGLIPMLVPTAAFPIPIFPPRSLGAAWNRRSYGLLGGLMRLMSGGGLDRWRRDALGLPPRPRGADPVLGASGTTVLHAYSEHVIPRPADWGPDVHVTGYWFLDAAPGWEPPAELAAFLDAGEPPVYVGFGSMPSKDPAALAREVVAGLERSGRRGIIAAGWGALGEAEIPPTVLRIDAAPHDWLLPRCSAVVHHGGAGTTAAGLRAGKPSIVCPVSVDQPFWGRIVHDRGVGPKPIPLRKLTADGLAGAIRATGDAAMRDRAEVLGRAIRSEDGVGRAVGLIGAALAGGAVPPGGGTSVRI